MMIRRLGYAGSLSVASMLVAACGGAQPPLVSVPGERSIAPNTASERVLYSFSGGNDGAYPEGAPILIKGEFYGTTVLGGNGGCAFVHGCGTVYKLKASGQERVLYAFKGGTDGEAPNAPLSDVDGNFLGTTVLGGVTGCKNGHVKGCGTVFEVTPSGKELVLYRFPGKAHGAEPVSGLTSFKGELYGEAAAGGTGKCYYTNVPGCGLIFKMRPSGKPKVVYTFSGGKTGGTPQGGLFAYEGNFYGTTSAGGGKACLFSYGCGTAFEMTPSGTQTTLHEFGRTIYAGALPESGLVFLNGAFYGTTFSGGTHDCALTGSFIGCGTVFKMTLSGKAESIYSFTGSSDGAYPNGLIAVNGNLYGTAGGNYSCGTLFEITPPGHETTIYQFSGADGCAPNSSLIYANGTFYGTTGVGGKYNNGTVFSVTP